MRPSSPTTSAWKLGLGAEVRRGGVGFRVWAPRARRAWVAAEGHAEEAPLRREKDGHFSGFVPGLQAGALYRYRLDNRGLFPDPCSRFQPQGPHGPSEVVDPAYRWKARRWRGPASLRGQVIYELHVGAFTPEGTFDAAARELPRLKELGVTLVELMPVAEFPGRFNWGYDGVDLFAPCRAYGRPEDLKRLVDQAHLLGLGVVLDVVYNHLGPDGNYLSAYSPDYFTSRHKTDWGKALNFDGPGAENVRRFFVRNACYWVSEFRMDGLRLDATQDIHDDGPRHVLADIAENARRAAAPRRILLIAENEPQNTRLVAAPERGGYGLDAIWVDDFHHAARVALTGHREAYFIDYAGTAREFVALARGGSLYQGQRYDWQRAGRGTPVTDEPGGAFVFFLQNHDQTANAVSGERLHALSSPGGWRALTALLLLAPETPLLFMGQENGTDRPFLFFADHGPDLAPLVHKGRKAYFGQFPGFATPEVQARVPDPGDPETFQRCKLPPAGHAPPSAAYLLHRDLLRLRREDPAISRQDRAGLRGAVLGPEAFVLRFPGPGKADRLLVLNLGAAFPFVPASEPLLAPPAGAGWNLLWSSEDPLYGGGGRLSPLDRDGRWTPGGASAVLLAAR